MIYVTEGRVKILLTKPPYPDVILTLGPGDFFNPQRLVKSDQAEPLSGYFIRQLTAIEDNTRVQVFSCLLYDKLV